VNTFDPRDGNMGRAVKAISLTSFIDVATYVLSSLIFMHETRVHELVGYPISVAIEVECRPVQLDFLVDAFLKTNKFPDEISFYSIEGRKCFAVHKNSVVFLTLTR